MFLLPLPLAFAAILSLAKGNLGALTANVLGYALYVCGAVLARRGLRNEADYVRRKFAQIPRYPLKTIGAAIIALATTVTAFFAAGHTLPLALSFGAGAFLGFYWVYGLDPRVAKHLQRAYGTDTTGQAIEALDNAERTITALEESKQRIANPELHARLERIVALARQVLAVLAEDPSDIRRARRFLNVYLAGAQRVVAGYVRTHPSLQSEVLDANLRRVLTTIEDVFRAQHQRLLAKDRVDLDVQIQVLSEQLRREGVN